MVGGLPFDLKQQRYNAVTEAAIREANDIVAGKIKVKTKAADSDSLPRKEVGVQRRLHMSGLLECKIQFVER